VVYKVSRDILYSLDWEDSSWGLAQLIRFLVWHSYEKGGPSFPSVGKLGTAKLNRPHVKDHPVALWTLIAAVVALSIWWDLYHPLGILFDIVIVIVLVVRYT
jgi:hypothetical protein